MITDIEIGISNLISLGFTACACLILLPFLRRRQELRTWFAGALAVSFSFLSGVIFRWMGGSIWSIIDSDAKLIGACCVILGISLEYWKNSRSPGGIVLGIALLALIGMVIPDIIAYLIMGGVCAWAFVLAIRNYQHMRTPSRIFIATLVFIIIIADGVFILNLLVPDLSGLPAVIAFGNIAMDSMICAFSVVVRVEVDFEKSHQMRLNIISMAAHELKTPLIPIYGWADLMLRGLKEGKSLNSLLDPEAAESIFRNAERLQAIIDRFLDVSAIESGRIKLAKERTQLTQLVSHAIQSVGNLMDAQEIAVTNHLGDEWVKVDPFRIEQVFINILSNAIKFSPRGTSVVIESSTRDHTVEVSIQDHGMGFDADELPEALELFPPAFLKHRGDQAFHSSGVGLYLCKNIVELHGGTLNIESPGKNLGSTVRVSLPLS